MRPYYRVIGLIAEEQSNGQGSALGDNGGVGEKNYSAYNGMSEPTYPNGNGGGSRWPRLFDLGLEEGIYYKIFNLGVGSSSIFHWTGRVNATVTGGDAATPLAAFNMSGRGITGGGAVAREGDVGFGPFGFLQRARLIIQQWPQIPEWISCYSNAESDGAATAADYQAGHEVIADYMLASGVDAHFCGLSSSGNNTDPNMLKLQGAYRAAIASRQAQGKPVYQGGDLYDIPGLAGQLYEESLARGTRVHLTMRGQDKASPAWRAAFRAAGF